MYKCEKCGTNLNDDCVVIWKCSECGKAFKVNFSKLQKIQEAKKQKPDRHLIKCSSCGSILDDGNEEIVCKCSSCGNVLGGNLVYFVDDDSTNNTEIDPSNSCPDLIECPECGKKILSDSRICSYCGYPFEMQASAGCAKRKKSIIEVWKMPKFILIVVVAILAVIILSIVIKIFTKFEYENGVITKLSASTEESGCGSKQDETVGKYKSEARYYYEQVNGIIAELNVIEEIDDNIESLEDKFFSATLSNVLFRSSCLENLISVNQYYNGLEISIEQMERLYNSISQNEEIEKIKENIDKIDAKCNDLKMLLEDATEYDPDFTDKYISCIDDITEQMNILYSYVKNEKSAVHAIEANNEYQEQLDEIEQMILGEKQKQQEDELSIKGHMNNPILEGESININFLNYAQRETAQDAPDTVNCNITFKSYDKEMNVVCLNFEIISSETNIAVNVGGGILYNSSLVYILVDENLATTFVDYDAVYGKEIWNTYINAYAGGNVDCNVNVKDSCYLQINYAPATEENRKSSSEKNRWTEEVIWFKLK